MRVLPVQQFTEMTSAGEGGGGDVGVMDNTGTVNWRSEKRQAFVSVLNLNSRPLGLILVPQTIGN